MKLSSKTTPWARKRLTDADRVLIELAEPREAEADFGYGSAWTCRIRIGQGASLRVLAEAFGEPTPRGAFRAALAAMKVPHA